MSSAKKAEKATACVTLWPVATPRPGQASRGRLVQSRSVSRYHMYLN